MLTTLTNQLHTTIMRNQKEINERRLAIVKEYRECKSMRQLARRLNLSVERVRKIIRRYEETTGDHVGTLNCTPAADLLKYTASDIERMIELRKWGFLWKEIAKDAGIKQVQEPARIIWCYLKRQENRMSDIEAVWPNGVPQWLINKYPPKHAVKVAKYRNLASRDYEY